MWTSRPCLTPLEVISMASLALGGPYQFSSLPTFFLRVFVAFAHSASLIPSYLRSFKPHGQSGSGKWATMFSLLSVGLHSIGGLVSDYTFHRGTVCTIEQHVQPCSWAEPGRQATTPTVLWLPHLHHSPQAFSQAVVAPLTTSAVPFLEITVAAMVHQ